MGLTGNNFIQAFFVMKQAKSHYQTQWWSVGQHIYTVECHYNTVQFITILHPTPQWQQQKINQISNSQHTSHTLPSQASYGVSIMRILKKIDCVIMAPLFICSLATTFDHRGIYWNVSLLFEIRCLFSIRTHSYWNVFISIYGCNWSDQFVLV